MTEKFLCVMACYDSETEEHLAGLQNRLYENGFCGTHTKGIPQHITLGTYPVEKEAEVAELVKKVAEWTVEFPVVFNHLGIFQGGEVLFVAPCVSKALLELQENFGKDLGWTPHTTMLIDAPEIIRKALPIVQEPFVAFGGRVTSICLYEFWPTRPILTVDLKKSENS